MNHIPQSDLVVSMKCTLRSRLPIPDYLLVHVIYVRYKASKAEEDAAVRALLLKMIEDGVITRECANGMTIDSLEELAFLGEMPKLRQKAA